MYICICVYIYIYVYIYNIYIYIYIYITASPPTRAALKICVVSLFARKSIEYIFECFLIDKTCQPKASVNCISGKDRTQIFLLKAVFL